MIIITRKINQDQPDEALSSPPSHIVSGVVAWRRSTRQHVWQPPTDVFETEKDIIVRVEVAGMRETDFSIEIDNKKLRIIGMRPDSKDRKAFHQMEIHYGEFCTEIEIPTPIEIEDVSAEYQNGILYITLPKALPRQIKVAD